jgi:hypothetical protein
MGDDERGIEFDRLPIKAQGGLGLAGFAQHVAPHAEGRGEAGSTPQGLVEARNRSLPPALAPETAGGRVERIGFGRRSERCGLGKLARAHEAAGSSAPLAPAFRLGARLAAAGSLMISSQFGLKSARVSNSLFRRKNSLRRRTSSLFLFAESFSAEPPILPAFPPKNRSWSALVGKGTAVNSLFSANSADGFSRKAADA